MIDITQINKRFARYIIVLQTVVIIDALWRIQFLSAYSSFFDIAKAFLAMTVVVNIAAYLFAAAGQVFSRFIRREEIVDRILLLLFSIIFVVVFSNLTLSWFSMLFPVKSLYLHLIAVVMVVATIVGSLFNNRFRTGLQSFIYHEKSILFNTYLLLLIVAVAFLFVVAASGGLGKADRFYPVNSQLQADRVILITLDMVGARLLSAYGRDTKADPNLSTFASECYVFQNAFANGPGTIFGMPSILRSDYPILIFKDKLKYKSIYDQGFEGETLASVLKKNGFKNQFSSSTPTWNRYLKAIGFYGDFESNPDTIIMGAFVPFWVSLDRWLHGYNLQTWFSQLIEKYFYSQLVWAKKALLSGKTTEDLAPIFDSLIDSAAKFKADNQPSFHWAHIFAFHECGSLTVPGSFKAQAARFDNAQDKMLSYIDYEFGCFINKLKAKGLYENSLIIVSADHGFGSDYNAEKRIRIPLMIHLPQQHLRKDLYTNAEQIDIAPTILTILGLDLSQGMRGETLTRYFGGGLSPRPKLFFCADMYFNKDPDQDGIITIFQEKQKFVCKYDYQNNSLSLRQPRVPSKKSESLRNMISKLLSEHDARRIRNE